MRTLALGGLIGPGLFAAITVLCGLLRPDYSHIHDFISELGATGTPFASLMNYAGFVPAGALLFAFGISIRTNLPRRPLVAAGAALVSLFGSGVALSGIFSCDIGCPQAGGTIGNLIHDRLAPLTFASGSLGAAVVGLSFRSLPSLHPLWLYSVGSGLLGLCLLGAVASTLESREFTGLWQRLLLLVLFGWCAAVGWRFVRDPSARPPAA